MVLRYLSHISRCPTFLSTIGGCWLLYIYIYISQTIFPLHPKSPSVDDIPIDDIFPYIFLLIDIFPWRNVCSKYSLIFPWYSHSQTLPWPMTWRPRWRWYPLLPRPPAAGSQIANSPADPTRLGPPENISNNDDQNDQNGSYPLYICYEYPII